MAAWLATCRFREPYWKSACDLKVIPDRFCLFFKADNTRLPCRIAWRDNERIGVAFEQDSALADLVLRVRLGNGPEPRWIVASAANLPRCQAKSSRRNQPQTRLLYNRSPICTRAILTGVKGRSADAYCPNKPASYESNPRKEERCFQPSHCPIATHGCASILGPIPQQTAPNCLTDS